MRWDTVCCCAGRMMGLLLSWIVAAVAIPLAELTAYLPPFSAFPLSGLGFCIAIMKFLNYTQYSNEEIDKAIVPTCFLANMLEEAEGKRSDSSDRRLDMGSTYSGTICRSVSPTDIMQYAILVILLISCAIMLAFPRFRFLLRWVILHAVLGCIVTCAQTLVHTGFTSNYYTMNLIEMVVFLCLICLFYLEAFWGVTFRAPSFLGIRGHPFEALPAFCACGRTKLFVTFPFEVWFFSRSVLLLAVPVLCLLLASCPLTYERLAFRSPAWWGGSSWQHFLLPLLSKLPWASDDDKLEWFCRLGISLSVQGLMADVPLQQGYDVLSTARLQLLMSWLGGRSFSVTTVRYLVESKANPNALDEHGQNVLVVAVKRDEVEVVRYLTRLKAVRDRINQIDESQRTALHYAESAEVVKLLVEAGANPSALDIDSRTPLMRAILLGRSTEVCKAFGWTEDGSTWTLLERNLPLLQRGAQLYDQLWDETLSSDIRSRRQEEIVRKCILPLLEENKDAVLTTVKNHSLRKALTSTKCPVLFASSLKANTKHFRGQLYDDTLRTCMEQFESELQSAKEELENDEIGGRIFQISQHSEKNDVDNWLVTLKVSDSAGIGRGKSDSATTATKNRFDGWPLGAKPSQFIAEGLPDWVATRNLRGAVKALHGVDVITSASELNDLLNGQHHFFEGASYSRYFSDRSSDIFWIALYVMYDIGKTKQINEDFQKGIKEAVLGDDYAQCVEFVGAPVKGFKRIIEKILDDIKAMERKDDSHSVEWPCLSKVCDASFKMKCRCAAEVKDKARNSFICNTAEHLWKVHSKFVMLDGTEVYVRPGVRLRFTAVGQKSSFVKPTEGGYSDLKYYCLVERVCYETCSEFEEPRIDIALVSESQAMLSNYFGVKNRMHIVYEAQRGDFDIRLDKNDDDDKKEEDPRDFWGFVKRFSSFAHTASNNTASTSSIKAASTSSSTKVTKVSPFKEVVP